MVKLEKQTLKGNQSKQFQPLVSITWTQTIHWYERIVITQNTKPLKTEVVLKKI